MNDLRLTVIGIVLSLCAMTAWAEPQISGSMPATGGTLVGDKPAEVSNVRGIRHSRVTPVSGHSNTYDWQRGAATGGSFTPFTYFQTGTPGTKHGFNPGTMSGGAAAGGLMISGSRYASDVKGGGSIGAPATPTNRPNSRKVGDHPLIPFPTPIGDAVLPLLVLALAYICVRAFRRKRA